MQNRKFLNSTKSKVMLVLLIIIGVIGVLLSAFIWFFSNDQIPLVSSFAIYPSSSKLNAVASEDSVLTEGRCMPLHIERQEIFVTQDSDEQIKDFYLENAKKKGLINKDEFNADTNAKDMCFGGEERSSFGAAEGAVVRILVWDYSNNQSAIQKNFTNVTPDQKVIILLYGYVYWD